MVAAAAALRDVGHRVTSYAWPTEKSVGTIKCMGLLKEAELWPKNWPNGLAIK
jgi:hypothetical protein